MNDGDSKSQREGVGAKGWLLIISALLLITFFRHQRSEG